MKRWCIQWEGPQDSPSRVTIREATEPEWRCAGRGHDAPGSFAHVAARSPRAALVKVFGRSVGARWWKWITEEEPWRWIKEEEQ